MYLKQDVYNYEGSLVTVAGTLAESNKEVLKDDRAVEPLYMVIRLVFLVLLLNKFITGGCP